MRIQDYLNQCDKELDPYYAEQERKNLELIDCWSKALWYAFWIAVGIGIWWMIIRGVICIIKH